MNITFVSANPHEKARPTLDDILSRGTDRIMIACAFCTGAGVVILHRHLVRLNRPNSCLVVSSETPTDVAAVNVLAKAAPGRVWMHSTGELPCEKKVGTALMHSKVFYAEAGENCWLWVGSHNLTGRATEGANLEAAVLLTGHPSETPFVAARAHIEACRAESSPCPFPIPTPPEGESVDVVVVHAEADHLPARSIPWHVRLGLRSKDYDWLLRPVADVRLHLYHRGSLSGGWKVASPWASYTGTLTGLNLTELHPENPGIPATWGREHYSITEELHTMVFSDGEPVSSRIVTQAVINITGPASADEVFLSAKPKAEADDQIGIFSLGGVDQDLTRFFTKESVRDGKLVYEIRQRGDVGWRIPLEDLRARDRLLLASAAKELDLDVWAMQPDDSNRMRHPLIMRAKFLLRMKKRG